MIHMGWIHYERSICYCISGYCAVFDVHNKICMCQYDKIRQFNCLYIFLCIQLRVHLCITCTYIISTVIEQEYIYLPSLFLYFPNVGFFQEKAAVN